MKKFLKNVLPPILLDVYKKIHKSKYGWHGNYNSWEEAKKNSTGYESIEILQKIRNSALKVKRGEAVYERDGVIFDEIQYSWPVLAGLMFAAAKSGGILKVLDFGGSLGTTYYQNRKFLDRLENVSWCIVEQKHFVDVGKEEFEDHRLKFYYDVKSCVEKEKPNVLLLSGVLQYLEKPYEVLDELLGYGFDFIIIDRTPFSLDNHEKIKLQIVPPDIYNASYPCWFFSFEKFVSYLSRNYILIEKFEAIDGKSKEYNFKGFIFEKRTRKN